MQFENPYFPGFPGNYGDQTKQDGGQVQWMWNMIDMLTISVGNKKRQLGRCERRFESNIKWILKNYRVRIYSCKRSNAFPLTCLTVSISGTTNFLHKGRVIAQGVSRWLPTAAARVLSRVWSSGVCGGQSTSVSPANVHSTNCSTITHTYHLGLVQ
jgi:hypothetical protein